MHFIIIQLQRQTPPSFGWFPSAKILAQSIFSIGRLHNDTCINASDVSSFNRRLQSLFTQFCLNNLCSHIVVLAKLKLQSMPSQSCKIEIRRVIGIWWCLLECQDKNLAMFLCANCSRHVLWHAFFREAFIVTEHIFVKCPKNKNFFDGQNGIWLVLKTSILDIQCNWWPFDPWGFTSAYENQFEIYFAELGHECGFSYVTDKLWNTKPRLL